MKDLPPEDLLQAIKDGVYVLDEEGRFVFVNQAIQERSGRPQAWWLGRTFLDVVHPDHHDTVGRNFERVMAGEKVPSYELSYPAEDGGAFWVEVNTTRIVHEGRQLVLGVSRDINARKRAERKVAESEEKYRSLVESLPYGVVILTDGGIAYASPAALGIFGVASLENVLGLSHEAFLGLDVRERSMELFRRRLAGDPDVPAHYRSVMRRIDGVEFPAELHVQPVTFQGKPAAQYVIVDVTDRVALEEQLRQAQKMEAIGTLAGGIAHDFNNLLTGILGCANLIKEETAEDSVEYECGDVIETAADKASVLVKQLLGFARKGKIQNRPVDVHVVVSEVASLLQRTLGPAIELRRELEAETPFVLGDPNQIEQAVMNLAVNARDAMPGGGTITFATRVMDLDEAYCRVYSDVKPGRYLVLTVRDTGPGIRSDLRDRIFEPFFTTKPAGEGTGMGLAVVYGIVNNHGGAVRLTSDLGQGTSFDVYLPLHATTDDRLEIAPPARPVAGAGTVLFVDDEDVVCQAARRMLSAVGYTVVTAHSGKEAVNYYRDRGEAVDLVILDLTMPGMDGRATFRELKKLDPGIRALLSTGHVFDGSVQDLLDEGMAGFVQKPYVLDQLSRAVAEALKA